MRRTPRFLAALLVAALATSPAFAPDALARAGGGASIGSRGSRTYSAPPSTNTAPGGGSSFGRSMTPEAPRTSPGYGTPGYAQPGFAQGGLSRGSAFTSGLMGGLIGAGIGGLLFGHGLTGGLDGGFSFIGLLLQLALLFFIGRWLFRRFMGGGQPAFAGLGGVMGRLGQPAPQMAGGMAGMGGSAGAQPAVAVTPADYDSFNQSLIAVQDAWSNADLNALRGLSTPEMASYFAEQLADQASRGVRNTVTAVQLDKGDLSEAWAENGRQYATVAMRFTMLDVTRDMSGRVVDGDATTRTTATELWTFVRAQGGRWLLSGIQQGR